MSKAPGVELRDDPEKNSYPMPLTATAKYDVEVRSFVFLLITFEGSGRSGSS